MDTMEQQYFQLTTVSRTEVWYFLVSIKSQYRQQADVSIRKGLTTTVGIILLALFILRIR